MTERSLSNRIVVKRHYGAAYTATETPSAGVDLQDLLTAEIIVDVGVVTNIANSPQPSWTFTLQHSDASGSGFAAVADTDVVQNSGSISSGVFATVDSADDDATIYRIGYVGSKRYVRVVATAANTPGSTPITVMVVGEPRLAPGSDS